MKRQLLALIVCSSVVFTGCDMSSIQDIKSKQDNISYDIAKDISYSEDAYKFTFKEPKVFGFSKEGTPIQETKPLSFYLGLENIGYTIYIPKDVEYVTDNYTFAYALDNSWQIQLQSNCPIENMSDYCRISNPQTISKNVIRTKEGAFGPQEAAIYIDDGKVLVIRSYNNPDFFATILQSLKTNRKTDTSSMRVYVKDEENAIDNTVRLKSIKLDESTVPVVTMNFEDTFSKQYVFSTGSLTITKDLKSFEDAKSFINNKLAVVLAKTTKIDKVFETDTVYYAEIGDRTIAVCNVNYNTSYCLWAIGDEARQNLIAFILGV